MVTWWTELEFMVLSEFVVESLNGVLSWSKSCDSLSKSCDPLSGPRTPHTAQLVIFVIR